MYDLTLRVEIKSNYTELELHHKFKLISDTVYYIYAL